MLEVLVVDARQRRSQQASPYGADCPQEPRSWGEYLPDGERKKDRNQWHAVIR